MMMPNHLKPKNRSTTNWVDLDHLRLEVLEPHTFSRPSRSRPRTSFQDELLNIGLIDKIPHTILVVNIVRTRLR